MGYKLRDYQEECITAILQTFQKHKKQLIQLPTGAGKTVIFWELISKYFKSALILVPSIQLGEQAEKQSRLYIDRSKLSMNLGSHKCKILRPYHIMSIQGLYRSVTLEKLNKNHFDIVVIDEAHRARAENFEEQFNKLHCYKYLLGVTATPFRTDQKSLLSIFDTLSYSKKLMDLIKEGHLCDLKGIRIETKIPLQNKKKKDDFTQTSLYNQLNKETRNELILNTYKKHCNNKKTLVFCLNIKHAEEIAQRFKNGGIRAQSIHGKIPLKRREKILEEFRNGFIDVLTNAQLLTEGFDEPSIEALIVARPTCSRILYTQMIGRGTRTYEGKDHCVVIDIADSYPHLCSFLSLPFVEEKLHITNRKHSDFLSLKEIATDSHLREHFEAEFAEAPLEFKEFDPLDLLKSPSPSMEGNMDPSWTTWKEELFLKWKRRKMEEFRAWRQSVNG